MPTTISGGNVQRAFDHSWNKKLTAHRWGRCRACRGRRWCRCRHRLQNMERPVLRRISGAIPCAQPLKLAVWKGAGENITGWHRSLQSQSSGILGRERGLPAGGWHPAVEVAERVQRVLAAASAFNIFIYRKPDGPSAAVVNATAGLACRRHQRMMQASLLSRQFET